MYIAIKVDIVRSRKLKARAEIQKAFLLAISQLNDIFSHNLASKFVVTHGDEAQGLVKIAHGECVLTIIDYLVDSMPYLKFRFGVSIGSLSTQLQDVAIGMDGEVWQRAKKAIDHAHSTKQFIKFRGFSPANEPLLEAIGNLLLLLQSKWSQEQREAIRLIKQGMSQTQAAEILNISEAAISKRLSAAGWKQYKPGIEAAKELLLKSLHALGYD